MVMQDTAVSSESILLEAEEVWVDSRRAHRDSAIRVGGLLADFVLARLYEADGLPEAKRIGLLLTRERSMRVAAERLRVKLAQAQEMVRVAKVVELFGDPGGLSYSALRAFSVFVRRKPCRVTRGLCTCPGAEVTPSESETWEAKPVDFGPDPADLYVQAVEGEWDAAHIRDVIAREVKVYRRGGDGPKPREDAVAVLPTLQKLGRDTDLKDLVDMVVEMIISCPRSEEFKRLLMERIK